MKIPLKTKNLHGIYIEGLFLLKTILLKETSMEASHVSFVLRMRQLNTCFSMQHCMFYMVSHPSSFRLVSTNYYYQYVWKLVTWYSLQVHDSS
jgi:hypothetical protein